MRLSAIMTDSVLKSGKNYYSQIFLEESKYKLKEEEIKSFIKDDLESSSDAGDTEEDIQENSK